MTRTESSRSSFYEWKEGICHFFTIFGHKAVQRESFVYVAGNKNVAVKPRGRIQSHSAVPASPIYCLLGTDSRRLYDLTLGSS